MCFCFVNKQQVLLECGQSKKVLAVSGDYSSLYRILKEAFEIDREIISRNTKLIGRILWIWLRLLMSRTGGEL